MFPERKRRPDAEGLPAACDTLAIMRRASCFAVLAVLVAASFSETGRATGTPDGLLAFLRVGRCPSDCVTAIFVSKTDGKGVRRLTSPCLDCVGAPAWSRDGSKIAYV